MFHFYTLWKCQKTEGFRTFSGGIEIGNSLRVDSDSSLDISIGTFMGKSLKVLAVISQYVKFICRVSLVVSCGIGALKLRFGNSFPVSVNTKLVYEFIMENSYSPVPNWRGQGVETLFLDKFKHPFRFIRHYFYKSLTLNRLPSLNNLVKCYQPNSV